MFIANIMLTKCKRLSWEVQRPDSLQHAHNTKKVAE